MNSLSMNPSITYSTPYSSSVSRPAHAPMIAPNTSVAAVSQPMRFQSVFSMMHLFDGE